MAKQSDELAQKAKNGYLFLILYTAGGGRGQRIRVNGSNGIKWKLKMNVCELMLRHTREIWL